MKIAVRIEDRLFEVEIADLNARPILATVEGQTFAVWPEGEPAAVNGSKTDHRPIPAALPTPASSAAAGPPSNAITAPIPGVIVSIAAEAGDTVSAGQELCVLEAMKMKNVIRAPREGQIAAIHVTVGQQVGQRQLLMEYSGR